MQCIFDNTFQEVYMLKVNIQDKLKEKNMNKNQFAKLMQIGYPAACALYDGNTSKISFDTL